MVHNLHSHTSFTTQFYVLVEIPNKWGIVKIPFIVISQINSNYLNAAQQ